MSLDHSQGFLVADLSAAPSDLQSGLGAFADQPRFKLSYRSHLGEQEATHGSRGWSTGGSRPTALGIDTKMSATELIIQLLKVAIGLAFGAYFVWWSLEVLDRLPLH
jgi:hypothetical protein